MPFYLYILSLLEPAQFDGNLTLTQHRRTVGVRRDTGFNITLTSDYRTEEIDCWTLTVRGALELHTGQ